MTFVVKSVPARICQNCGEEYVDEKITMKLLKEADQASRQGIQVDIRNYAVV
ncbi:MAG: YgiT-type zinc finger protein [Deltaproteobacteria bacterium]|nr:YgiT-type zinc finger protein [Deltaproteobacteria bacterium]